MVQLPYMPDIFIYDCDDLLASFIWFFTCQFLYALIFPCIHSFNVILLSFPTQWHAFSWLVSWIIIIIISITIKWKSAVLVSMKPWVQLPYKPEFSNFLFTTAKVVSITTVILFHFKQESLREFYRGHFCLGNPRGRVVFINKFVGRHENLFYCKYS